MFHCYHPRIHRRRFARLMMNKMIAVVVVEMITTESDGCGDGYPSQRDYEPSE